MATKRNELPGVDEMFGTSNGNTVNGNKGSSNAANRKEEKRNEVRGKTASTHSANRHTGSSGTARSNTANIGDALQYTATPQEVEKRTIYLPEELALRVDELQFKLRKQKVKVSFSRILIAAIERGWESDEVLMEVLQD